MVKSHFNGGKTPSVATNGASQPPFSRGAFQQTMPNSLLQQYFLECGLKEALLHQAEFEKFLALYLVWNSKINLSALKTEKEVYLKHFCDSLLLCKLGILKPAGQKVLDLGTGGGFPLLPLAIMFPQNQFTGLDSVQKKIKVVLEIARALNLKNVQAVSERAEELGRKPNFRERFDLVTTRAFAKWHTLLELALPFVKIGGSLIAYQGPQIVEELENSTKVIRLLGGEMQGLSYFTLPENSGERILVEIRKIKPTPAAYPRQNGLPGEKPLE